MRATTYALLLALAATTSCTKASHDYADIVFRGGPVYTVDSTQTHASAVAVKGTRIVFVGDDAGATKLVGPQTHVIELAGRMLLPAFHDSHLHPVTTGLRMSECALDDLTTPAQVADSIAKCAKANPSGSERRKRPRRPGKQPSQERSSQWRPSHHRAPGRAIAGSADLAG